MSQQFIDITVNWRRKEQINFHSRNSNPNLLFFGSCSFQRQSWVDSAIQIMMNVVGIHFTIQIKCCLVTKMSHYRWWLLGCQLNYELFVSTSVCCEALWVEPMTTDFITRSNAHMLGSHWNLFVPFHILIQIPQLYKAFSQKFHCIVTRSSSTVGDMVRVAFGKRTTNIFHIVQCAKNMWNA